MYVRSQDSSLPQFHSCSCDVEASAAVATYNWVSRFEVVARHCCADLTNATKVGGEVVDTRSNGVRASKRKQAFGKDAEMGREEGRTVVIVDGDEESKVTEHKLHLVRKQLKVVFKDPTCNIFFSSKHWYCMSSNREGEEKTKSTNAGH